MVQAQAPQAPSKFSENGIKVVKSVTIDRPIEDMYAFWHDPTNYPTVMDYIKSVQVIDDKKAHWTIKLPGGVETEFDVEVYTDVPNEVISWRSLEGSELQNAGSVRFQPAPPNRGNEVQLTVEFVPPAGKIGQALTKLLGDVPAQYIAKYLYQFKQKMETGETATTEGQSSGRNEQEEQEQEKVSK